MNRCQSSIVTDPTQTMELLRVILQQEINAKIQNILNTYIGEWHKSFGGFSGLQERNMN